MYSIVILFQAVFWIAFISSGIWLFIQFTGAAIRDWWDAERVSAVERHPLNSIILLACLAVFSYVLYTSFHLVYVFAALVYMPAIAISWLHWLYSVIVK